jgi:hypothetical protein
MHWVNRKEKQIATIFVIVLLTLSVTQSLLDSSIARGETNSTDKAYWLDLARKAWQFFRVGQGVNAQTGLHMAAIGWPYFTDWDLGIYIQAIIDAQQIGILGKAGDWGADYRIDKVLSFLENRELSRNQPFFNYSLPYSNYNANTGAPAEDPGTGVFIQQNACDTGKLLVALSNLKEYDSNNTNRINRIVYDKVDYEPLKKRMDTTTHSTNIYDYYIARGFAAFWPDRYADLANHILNNLISAPTVETYGIKLPVASLNSEVILHLMFEFLQNPQVSTLAQNIYSAQEARFNVTGKYTAWSEGNTYSDPSYLYEWIVFRDGRTWVLKDPAESDVQITPIVYLKSAVSYDAIYHTQYTKSMVQYIQSHIPTPNQCGFMDGVDENGRRIETIIDKTNGFTIAAAKYAIIGQPPAPTPSPSPSPSPSPTATSSSTPGPTYSPTATFAPNQPSQTPTNIFITSTPTTATPASSQSPTPSPTASTTAATSPKPSALATQMPEGTSIPSPIHEPEQNTQKGITTAMLIMAVSIVIVAASCGFFIKKKHSAAQSRT